MDQQKTVPVVDLQMSGQQFESKTGQAGKQPDSVG
jgi:hypothetical protein